MGSLAGPLGFDADRLGGPADGARRPEGLNVMCELTLGGNPDQGPGKMV